LSIFEESLPVNPTIPFPSRAAARALLAAALALAPAAAAPASDAALVLARTAAGAGAETLELSIDELAALPQVTVVTETEFTNGKVAFTGPLVREVLQHLGLDDAESLRFTAANDYYVDIPTSDFQRYNAILALEQDGKRLSRRDKGPLWLMYPISDFPELRDPVYLGRLIWQVIRIEAL
jgi:hypothetical protein